MARPRRQHKHDRLLNPDARATETRIDMALAPFDRLGTEMERKWGIDQLPALVSTDTADRYGRLMGDLNDAIRHNNADEVCRLASIGIRALKKMDEEAESLNAPKSPGDFIEYDLDGFKFALMPDNAHWQAVKEKRPDLQIFTMREAAIALKAMMSSKMVAATKAEFPGAEIQKVTPLKEVTHDFWERGGDDIPI